MENVVLSDNVKKILENESQVSKLVKLNPKLRPKFGSLCEFKSGSKNCYVLKKNAYED